MKSIKINGFKPILGIALLCLLFCFSCEQSGQKKSNSPGTSSDLMEIQTDKPAMELQLAILSDNIDVVKQHLSYGTDLNVKDAMTGSTPLITAASFGKKEIAKALIDGGADLSIKNYDGATALHTAAFFCRTEIVQLLIDAKSDTTLKNNFGVTPRESVMGPFDQIKPIYEMLKQQLQPMGIEIDLDYIEKTRPVIAKMLQF